MTNDKRILLDDIQKAVGCAYLSDLHFSSSRYRKKIVSFLRNISDEEYALEEWIRAAVYIADPTSEVTSIEEAKQILTGTNQ